MGFIILTAPFACSSSVARGLRRPRGIGFHYERMTTHGAGEVAHGPNNDPPAFLMGQRDSHTHARGP